MKISSETMIMQSGKVPASQRTLLNRAVDSYVGGRLIDIACNATSPITLGYRERAEKTNDYTARDIAMTKACMHHEVHRVCK